MPPRRGRPPVRRAAVNQQQGQQQEQQQEQQHEQQPVNPSITLDDVANLFNQQINQLMPNLITQIAQALNVAPSVREEGSVTQGQGGQDQRAEVRDPEPRVTQGQACTFNNFTKCNPPKFSGEEGAAGLLSWYENMEAMLHHSEVEDRKMVEFASSQFTSIARSWWVNTINEIGRPAAYAWTWEELKRKMNEQFCAKDAVLDMEQEFWNLQMNELEIEKYVNRFNELLRLVPHMASTEERKIDRFI